MHAVNGYTPEQIADSLGLEVEAVVLTLAQAPRASANEASTAKDILQRLADMRAEACEVMTGLLYAEEAPVRLKAAEYILDAGLGLKTPKASTVPVVSAAQFNELMREARGAYELQLTGGKTALDV